MTYTSEALTSVHTPMQRNNDLHARHRGWDFRVWPEVADFEDRMYRNERQTNGLKHIYQGRCDIVAQRCMKRHADGIDYIVEPPPQRCRLAEVVT